MNTLQPVKSKELCNNFLKGRCTYGEKCKYVHGKTPPIPLKAIADVPPTVPPSGKPTKPKIHARPNYISEAHRIKLGAMTGKVTANNPLGISQNQEVILKYLQSRDNDWDMRGGRDSNGNEYAMNMFSVADPPSPLTPDEDPSRRQPEITISEHDVDSEDYDYLYSSSPYPFCRLEPFRSTILSRSATMCPSAIYSTLRLHRTSRDLLHTFHLNTAMQDTTGIHTTSYANRSLLSIITHMSLNISMRQSLRC